MKGAGAAAVAALLGLAWAASGSTAPRLGLKATVWVAVKRGGVIVPGLAALWEDGPPDMAPDHYDQENRTWRWLFGTPEQKRAQMTMAYAGENVLVEPREPSIEWTAA